MKSLSGILAFAVALLAPEITQAQGTTYLSNLGQTSAGSLAVGSNSWLALEFNTGTSPSGYTLDSVQLALADASGNPSGFTILLYWAASGAAVGQYSPGGSIGTFSGSLSPATGGTFTYTPASNMTLSPNQTYYIVLTAGTAVASSAYALSFTDANSNNSSEGWGSSLGGVGISSDGFPFAWGLISGDYGQFAINAIVAPEPDVLGLFGLGGLAFLWHRRKSKAV